MVRWCNSRSRRSRPGWGGEQLLAQYEKSILTAFREAEDALAAVNINRRKREILYRQVEAAQAATDLTWIRYQEGMTSFLEVLDIQRSLYSSQLSAIDVETAYVTSVVQLYSALGGGWNPENPEDTAAQKQDPSEPMPATMGETP